MSAGRAKTLPSLPLRRPIGPFVASAPPAFVVPPSPLRSSPLAIVVFTSPPLGTSLPPPMIEREREEGVEAWLCLSQATTEWCHGRVEARPPYAPPQTATPTVGVAEKVKVWVPSNPPSHGSQTDFRVLVQARQRASWHTGLEPQDMAPIGTRAAASGVWPAFPGRPCHHHEEEEMGE